MGLTFFLEQALEFFEEFCGIPTVDLKLFDADLGSADDELGSVVLNLRRNDPDSQWIEEDWWPLKHKGKSAGSVHIKFEWHPCPPPPTRRGVRITIFAAKGLRNSLLDANDCYVLATIGGASSKTSVIDDGGDSPVWGSDGEVSTPWSTFS